MGYAFQINKLFIKKLRNFFWRIFAFVKRFGENAPSANFRRAHF
jgi:hypothetical protein